VKKADFDNLMLGVKQLGATLRGELTPAKVYEYDPQAIRRIRAKLRLSQAGFARLIGVPTGTLRNWEQGLRRPRGPSLALLRVAQRHPEALADALRS
jgi:putative transcriptional regulator